MPIRGSDFKPGLVWSKPPPNVASSPLARHGERHKMDAMAPLTLRLANDLPSNPSQFVAERMLSYIKPDVWLWADTRAACFELLLQLRDELGDEADRLVKMHNALYLRSGGRVQGMSRKERPDGEKRIAVWLATSQIPNEYMSRLMRLGQCEEFWARPGSVPSWPDGSDWRKGAVKPT